jgi:hypothetical protein
MALFLDFLNLALRFLVLSSCLLNRCLRLPGMTLSFLSLTPGFLGLPLSFFYFAGHGLNLVAAFLQLTLGLLKLGLRPLSLSLSFLSLMMGLLGLALRLLDFIR